LLLAAPKVPGHFRKPEPEEGVMYVIREVLHCKPGRVRQMVDKFKGMSTVLKDLGHEPLRLLTDVTGEPFWTVVAEANVEKIEDFFAMEQALMANDSLRQMMADYHDLVEDGRREIYRIVS
jgi:hypothetical protein